MNEPQSIILEVLIIFTDFLSKNSIEIVLLVLLIVFRGAISGFISRLTSLKYKSEKSQLGMEALAPLEERDQIDSRIADGQPPLDNENTKIEEKEEKEKSWLPDMHKAFSEGRLEDAEAAFKRYALDETDDVKLEENKAFYLYLRFDHGKDNSAISELEQLARSATTEGSKFNTLTWLSFCLRGSMQYHKETEIWQSASEEISSESLKNQAIVNLAQSLNREDSPSEARKILVNHLMGIEESTQKGLIFEALSKVEDSLGNKSLSIYCKDKSLEFDPNNRDELFNSAYSASNEDINEITISNYLKLVRIDRDNSTALNNLGVQAQEAGLKIKAVDQYKKSSELNYTLAMANQGYLLLGAGFTEEAEKIAKEALKIDNPHNNVHSLLSEINKRKEQQNKEWDELSKNALIRQKMIREYTEQFYLGSSKKLIGDWKVNDKYFVNIKIDDDTLKAYWIEKAGVMNNGEYTVKIIGKVSGSTFDGTYSRIKNGNPDNTLLGLSGNTTSACIGYFSEKEREIKVISKKLDDKFSLTLSQE